MTAPPLDKQAVKRIERALLAVFSIGFIGGFVVSELVRWLP